MKNRYLLVPAIGLVASTPAMAQSSQVNDAVRDVVTTKPVAPPPAPTIPPPAPPMTQKVKERTIPPPAPPALRVAPASPLPPYPRNPRLVNYRDALPTQADYPLASWQNGEEGFVRYTVDVDVDGKATDCTIAEGSGYPALDAKTCEVVLERAEFKPALDDENAPVAGSITRTYNWRKREPELPSMSVTFQYVQNEQGETVECKLVNMEGDVPEKMRRDMERDLENGDACPRGISGRRGIPYRDENGVPVAKQVTVTFEVKVEEPAE